MSARTCHTIHPKNRLGFRSRKALLEVCHNPTRTSARMLAMCRVGRNVREMASCEALFSNWKQLGCVPQPQPDRVSSSQACINRRNASRTVRIPTSQPFSRASQNCRFGERVLFLSSASFALFLLVELLEGKEFNTCRAGYD